MPDFNEAYWTRNRGYYRGRITFYMNKLNQAEDNITLSELELIKNRLSEIRHGFDKAQSEMEMNVPNEEDLLRREEFDNMFYELEKEVFKLIQSKRAENNVSKKNIKLPDISIPKYTGDVKQWLAFKTSFTKLIGEKDIDDVMKFQYLESSLIGNKAHDIIRSVTNSDFQTAWSRLIDEYDKTTVIVERHLKDLYDASVQKKDDAESLQKFLDTVEVNLSALESLEAPVKEWDMLLVYHLSNKLDTNSRKELEKIKQPDKLITFDEFKDFVKTRIRLLHAISRIPFSTPLATSTPKSEHPFRRDSRSRVKSFVTTNAEQSEKCQYCEGSHKLLQCSELKSLNVEERQKSVKEKGLCFNCLRKGHSVSQCESKGRCRECKKKHHTMIHLDLNNSKDSSKEELSSNAKTEHSNTIVSYCTSIKNIVLLATAVVYLKNNKGDRVLCRAVLDNASTTCFITEDLVQKLRLKKKYSYTVVNGVNASETSNKYQTSAVVQSRINNFEIDLDFVISKKIVGDLPVAKVDINGWSLPPQEQLADPYFNEPEKVDLLLGSEVFFAILSGDKKQLQTNLWLLSTEFGFIIGGKVTKDNSNSHSYCIVEELKSVIQKFWETESVDLAQNYSLDEQQAENNYVETVERLENGRYSVALPFNSNIHKLGESKHQTQQLFRSSEARLLKNPDKHNHYREFMQEMIDLNHMSEAPEDSSVQNYIVHHQPLQNTVSYSIHHSRQAQVIR